MDGSMESESPTLYEYEPTNIFSLDLVLEGFLLKEQSGRKSYVKGKTITWNVDSEYFTMDVLMDGLGAELRVGRNQSVTVWYFDMIMAQDVRLTHKDQLHVMFHMYKAEKKLTLTVVVLDNSDSETPVPIIDNVVHVPEATIADNDVLLMGMQDFPLKQSAQVDPSTLVLETDPFDMVEEYVGVDDEYMYVVEPSAPVPVESIEQGNKIWEEEDTGADVFVHHEEEEVIDIDPAGYTVVHDAENPDIRVGALFPDIVTFRKSIRQHAILVGFKLAKIKTDKTRFMAECAHGPCPWRIHASTLQDGRTVMIKTLPFEHNCPTTKLSICTMASQGWIADKIGDWVKKNPGVGAKDAKGKLEDEFNIKLKYNKAWDGMKVALYQIHGSYEDCFPLLFNWKAEIENKCPGSIIEIELLKNGDKYHFNRMFVAFKPCIDGFLAGCRPYVGVDSTALNGKFKGQLASATSVDGHNWLYYVAFAVFDSETGENWKWFMKQLHRAIGSPPGLVISSDACKGLETAIDLVFPNCENRECVRHLYANFMKKFHGKVYTENLYPAARSFSHRKFMYHMKKIREANPTAIEYLEIHHNRLWYRCGFGEASKVDYLTNNISESFNKQIKDFKGINVLNLFDKIREIITEKFYIRGQVSKQLKGRILPHVIKQLNALSKTIGRNKILWTSENEQKSPCWI
ncbi:uncharacterized protein LOC123411455 isoform X1 [Hordeum vulgare subsp. vulgare]|uniref:uncharacterized protein LOC123411455 isoform X1 n=1 Tax=Hordeum vulgare subsp. vulgare TaxID=112509 RepID=UPI001D1A4C03|nr:uncharacterized protein LOC123411455 isoform X1 [Hordeum vulgare subsp. vulgare]